VRDKEERLLDPAGLPDGICALRHFSLLGAINDLAGAVHDLAITPNAQFPVVTVLYNGPVCDIVRDKGPQGSMIRIKSETRHSEVVCLLPALAHGIGFVNCVCELHGHTLGWATRIEQLYTWDG
jgi:hypothetical protein